MQGQRNSVEQIGEVFGFDHGSSSSNPVMDQQACWNNFIGSVESPTRQYYEMNRTDATIPYGNEAHQGSQHLGSWESGEASSSVNSLNYGSSTVIKAENLNFTGGLRIGERHPVADHSLDNVEMNLNSNVNDQRGQSSNANSASQGSEHYGDYSSNGTDPQDTELRVHPYTTFLFDDDQPEPPPSSDDCQISLDNYLVMQEDIDQRPGSSLDGCRLACKRKKTEGVHGQSSTSASTSLSHRNDNIFDNIPSSSNPAPSTNLSSHNSLLAPSSNEEQQLPHYGAATGLPPSRYNYANEGTNNSGSSERSFQARTATGQHITPYGLWPSSSAMRNSSSWNHQMRNLRSTFDEPQEVTPAVGGLNLQHQHPVNAVPGFPQIAHCFPGHGASSSRAGSLQNRVLGSEEVTARNVVAPIYSDPAPFPPVDLRHLLPEPSIWSPDARLTAIARNSSSVSRDNASSMVDPPARSPFPTLRRIPARNLSGDSGRPSGALRGQQHPRLRSGALLERQGDSVWGVPLQMTREGRRLIEIRNALEMIHRGESVRFENIFYGGVDIQDRHRDMRLDIDNMSYEDLLALEERIGNVNTGLSDEAVMKLLKQRKFSSWRMASLEHEPCCICQEEYVDGDDLGTLHCGHSFHVDCIKQWLVVKNLCPVCKNTALKT